MCEVEIILQHFIFKASCCQSSFETPDSSLLKIDPSYVRTSQSISWVRSDCQAPWTMKAEYLIPEITSS